MDKKEESFAVSSMMNEVDASIAQSLKELSPNDREKSYWDIHGISGEIRESPALIAQSLALMEQEIDQILEKDDYNVAEYMSPDYVRNPALRLKFLRGERFSVRPAALKLVKHFQVKRFMFGASNLVKDIDQDDLSDEDIKVLYSGYVQWLPLKDSSQRTVFIMYPLMSYEQVPMLSRSRVSFYLRMVAMEDVHFQRNGAVAVISAAEVDSGFCPDFSGSRDGGDHRLGKVSDALPGSLHGVHICFPRNQSFRSFLFSSLLKIALAVLNPLLKVRVRIHRGETMEECMQSLQSFGITTAVIPQSPQDNEYQTKLLESRRNLERERRNDNDIVDVDDSASNINISHDLGESVCSPSRYDIILGRGPRCSMHPGNIRLRKLVEDAKGIYDQCHKREKTEIIARVVHAIQQQGRFLLESDGGWVEVADKVARQKVGHTFRDVGKKWKKYRPRSPN